jgi:hypothetical protein
MDFGVVDVASCMGQETHTIHLNFQVGLKAHLEERGREQPIQTRTSDLWRRSIDSFREVSGFFG